MAEPIRTCYYILLSQPDRSYCLSLSQCLNYQPILVFHKFNGQCLTSSTENVSLMSFKNKIIRSTHLKEVSECINLFSLLFKLRSAWGATCDLSRSYMYNLQQYFVPSLAAREFAAKTTWTKWKLHIVRIEVN